MDKDIRKLLESYPCEENQRLLSITQDFNIITKEFKYICAITTATKIYPKEGFVNGKLPELRSLRVRHLGNYRHLGNAWSIAMMHLRALKKKPYKGLIGYEVYLNDPQRVAVEKLETGVIIPLR